MAMLGVLTMMPLRNLSLLALAGLVGSAPATFPLSEGAVAQSPRRECFSARTVSGFRPAGNDAVDVRISRNREYRLTLAGYCPDVDWSLRIALRTRGGSSYICAGLDAELLVPGPTGLQRCQVTEVRRLTPEEIAARR